MLLECEEFLIGFRHERPIPAKKFVELQKSFRNWQLLFQFDSTILPGYFDSTILPGYSKVWLDCGVLYYYIKMDDLMAKKFDNCMAVFQCY